MTMNKDKHQSDRILIIDDEPDIIKVMMRLLFDSGYVIDTAETGEAAISLLGQHDYSLMLSDMRMHGMSGSEFFEIAQAKQPLSTRIMVSGTADIDSVVDAINIGKIHSYIQKPWRNDDLLNAIHHGVSNYKLRVQQADIEERIRQKNEILKNINGELETLVNNATQELEQQRAELLALNQQLETKVSERTSELNEEKLNAEAANRSKSIFLANMSHELRTPLTAIKGYAHLLKDFKMDDDATREALSTIIRTSDHFKTLLDDILDLSKIEANKLELDFQTFSLSELLSDLYRLCQMLIQDKNVVFEIEFLAPIPALILSDATRLKQILFNLANNAIKFTDDGEVRLRLRHEDDQLFIEVKDNGLGMDEQQLSQIFTPFVQGSKDVTRKYGGTGLGLAITHQLLGMLGGDISVSSARGQGTVFSISLPCEPQSEQFFDKLELQGATASPVIDVKQMSDEQGYTGRILLCEDNLDTQKFIRYLLSNMGVEVDTAVNGEEAIERAIAGDYNLILMDIQMPVLDGVEAATKLTAIGVSTPIIAFTANTSEEHQARYERAGFSGFLAKPVDVKDFNALLKKHLSGATEPLSTTDFYESEAYQKIKQRFVARLSDYICDIDKSATNKEWHALRQTLHDLKGSAGQYEFPSISRLAAFLMQEIDKGAISDEARSGLVQALVGECEWTLKSLKH